MFDSYIFLIKFLVEVGILWAIFYFILIFARETRGVQVLRGIVFLILFFAITQRLGLDTINWIFTKLFAIYVVAFLVIFQPELRRGLANIGQQRFAGFFFKESGVIKEIVDAAILLANRKIGGLIAIEREARLNQYVESGVELDAKTTTELLVTIFTPATPLHDGGVIISGDRIIGAGCLFPLTQNPKVSKTMGTRHRAGIGLSEETDAVVIIISEETGSISIALDGNLNYNIDKQNLAKEIVNIFRPDKKKRGFLL